MKRDTLIIIVVFIAAMIFVKSCGDGKQMYPTPHPRLLAKNIQKAEGDVTYHISKSIDQKALEKKFGARFDSIMLQLNRYRTSVDSSQMDIQYFKNIVQIQDTALVVSRRQLAHKDSVNYHLDTTVIAQRYIIDSQDTLITTLKFKLKKRNKQLFGSLVLNTLQTGIIIFK